MSKAISSSKCDFSFSMGDMKFQVQSFKNEIELRGKSPQGKVMVQSSKCDWVISNSTIAGGLGSIVNNPDGLKVNAQIDRFAGHISSDKCDYQIRTASPSSRLRVNSDKCDWSISARNDFSAFRSTVSPDYLGIKGKIANLNAGINSDKCDFRITAQRPNEFLRIDSDKCDWSMSMQNDYASSRIQLSDATLDIQGIGKGIGGGISSSKCDWRIFAKDALIRTNVIRTPENIISKNDIGNFNSSVSSSKCDYLISSINETIYPVDFKLAGIGSNMNVASSKCDWKIQALGGSEQLSRRPEFNASLSSSKCDFVLNIEFGIQKGHLVKVKAVSSSKCDFKIQDIIETGIKGKTIKSDYKKS